MKLAAQNLAVGRPDIRTVLGVGETSSRRESREEARKPG